jgi:hypothetical protein
MTTNFRILPHRNSENLHLKLMGDFDGNAAHELLKVIWKNAGRTSRVFIHTSCLTEIHPFGLTVLRDNLSFLKGLSLTLVFTGDHAGRLTPEKPVGFDLSIATGNSVEKLEDTQLLNTSGAQRGEKHQS